jgi:hypothetical protein
MPAGRVGPSRRHRLKAGIEIQVGSRVNDTDIVGYTVTYEQEELQFPVYIVGVLALVFFVVGLARESVLLFALGVPLAVVVYYNYPLLETGRPRLGAGQYGLFVEGLGLVQWRAIDAIEVADRHFRGDVWRELHIILKKPLGDALIIDWRRRPIARRFMRLPWSLTGKDTIRVPLDIMDKPAEVIHETLLRMWRYYRGQ